MLIKKRAGRFLAIAVILLLVLILAACQAATPAPTSTATAAPTETAELPTPGPGPEPTFAPVILEGAKKTASGLQYLELVPGTGETPKAGDIITMHYIASLADGTELANSYTDNQPYTTVLGQNRLLPGWEEGIGLMKVNGKTKLVLSPELAFGTEGNASIPPNAEIVIEMELLSAKAAPLPEAIGEDKLTKSSSGLLYYDLAVGDGAEAAKNSTVSTNYTLWVKNESGGYSYIASSEGAPPLQFVIGRGDIVFPGWEEGATGMKVGGKRLLVVPPALGLGQQEMGAIPANSTLVMEIELTEAVEPRAAAKVDEKDYTTTASGLKYYDLKAGTGASPQSGQTV
ncbi:MAG: FKBP-type peptidyl-prolyl cis-trans isomerase, partial [Anaerolineaceae bacterium]|nr:FKBP-type peptidyl-prolyl cis-trans isomerase [Anaerolineaceae bacterium]